MGELEWQCHFRREEMEIESLVLKQCKEEQNRKEAARETFSSTPQKALSDTDQELLLEALLAN